MEPLAPVLVPPPAAKPIVSVARVEKAWYVAATSKELRGKPLASTVLGIPLVLFRDGGGAARALLDRCAHRNVPLSLGEVAEGRLRCGYHGWCFDGEGVCRFVPGLLDDHEGRARRVPAFPVREQDGFVWVWTDAETEPDCEPWRPPFQGAAGWATGRRVVEAEATLHAVCENALDVPHTAFLHRGLFRGSGKTNEIEAIVRRHPRAVECEYVGEPRPEGLAGRLLAPGGGVVQHWDRFIHPSIAQVEYRIGDDAHVLITSVCTPIRDFHTRLYALVSWKLRFPRFLVRMVLQPLGLRIFRQDARILRRQTDAIRAFGGEQYASTDIDLLGGPIWRLLKEAERGDLPPENDSGTPPEELRRVRLRV